jgi:hypothetical protein
LFIRARASLHRRATSRFDWREDRGAVLERLCRIEQQQVFAESSFDELHAWGRLSSHPTAAAQDGRPRILTGMTIRIAFTISVVRDTSSPMRHGR